MVSIGYLIHVVSKIFNIISSTTKGPKNLVAQKFHWLTFKDGEYFHSLNLSQIGTLDFTCAIMLVIKASKHANFISMVLG
jgi:hypothetical protein